jgi:hypothetical protein
VTPKKRRRPGPHFELTTAKYIEAHRRAYAWADKALAYRNTGKVAQAKAAEQKAMHWLRRIKEIEARAARCANAKP